MHSIRQIRVVKALAQHRHFGRAARALGVSQPNLTRSLKQIEDTLGVPLFERQGVTPTLFGEIVLRHGEKALANFHELTREIMLIRGLEVGELRLVMAPYPADISGNRAVGLLLDKYPNVFVEIRSANWETAVEDVMDGGVDIAFAETTIATDLPELEIETIRTSPLTFFCAASHPLACKAKVSLDQIFEYPWAGPSLPGRIAASLPKVDRPFAVYDEAGNRFHPRALVGSFAAAKAIVLNSRALSAAIPSQIERELAEGAFVQLPLETPWLTLNYGFIYKSGRTLAPAATAFMEDVRRIESGIQQ